MKLIKAGCIAVILGAAAGCATVNIGGQSDQAGLEAASLAATQIELREAADALSETTEAEGWARADGMAVAARAAWRVLVHGRGDDADASESPVDIYVEERHASAAAEFGVAPAIAGDVATARQLAYAVNLAAESVAMDAEVSRRGIVADLRIVERSLSQSQRSLTLFARAAERVDGELDDASRELLNAQLVQLETEVDRMSAAADALNARRSEPSIS